MDLPPSALLGRLQAFLPEMEKANKLTERLATEGKIDLIDANLEVATDNGREEDGEETDKENDGEGDAEEGEEREGEAARSDGRIIQMDFALGDFDENPIARMEAEKEEAGEGTATVELAANGNTACRDVQGEEADERDRVGETALLCLSEEKASWARKETRKPLIEEL